MTAASPTRCWRLTKSERVADAGLSRIPCRSSTPVCLAHRAPRRLRRASSELDEQSSELRKLSKFKQPDWHDQVLQMDMSLPPDCPVMGFPAPGSPNFAHCSPH